MATEVRTVPPSVEAQTESQDTQDMTKSGTRESDQASKEHDTSEAPTTDKEEHEKPPAKHEHDHNNDQDRAAALLIQRNYRGYRTRRQLDGCNISADTRWSDAIHRMRLEQAHKQSNKGQNDTSSRWKRGKLLAGQLSGTDKASPSAEGDEGDSSGQAKEKGGPVEGGPSLKPNSSDVGGEDSMVENGTKVGDVPGANEGNKVDNIRSIAQPSQRGLRLIEWWTRGSEAQELSKRMEEQYWLEMVDRKHRYGSNLKYYHQAWQSAETKDNFFQWLDEGEGKKLDLEDCPRERLDSECVIYLSAEQRRNYIVDIEDGKLIWRRNGKPVDTARNKHKDLGDGRGIVDLGEDEQEERRQERERRGLERGLSSSSLESFVNGSDSSSSSDSSGEEGEMTSEEKTAAVKHYQSKRSGKSRHLDAFKASNWSDMLLRKTIGNNTWIYVYNSRHELYVGLKQTGYFQHSSFLYGGRVLSAGLLKVDQGTLTSLSPLSGHYRAGTAHFRYFVKKLQDSDVDLDRVTLSKSLLLLAGMEQYGKMMKKAKKGGKKDKKKDDKQKDKDAKKSKPSLTQRIKEKLHIGSSHKHTDGDAPKDKA